MNEKNILSEIFLSEQAKRLEVSPLVRDDKHLFTFSPFQDTENYYKEAYPIYGYKIQECFREAYPNNLVNPLSVPYQYLVSLHCFKRSSKIDIISNFINYYLINNKKFSRDNVYLIIPDIPEIKDLFKEYGNNTIAISQNRLKCTLPLKGNHFYIKIVYHYLDGLISIANFVLVDFDNKKFQLDSVIFPERINMIYESKNYIYSQEKYQDILNEILQLNMKDVNLQHFLIGNLIAAIKLLSITKNISSKKQGYTIKKLLKEVYIESKINNISLESNLEKIICAIENYLNIFQDDSIKKLILDNYHDYLKNYSKQQRIVEKKLKPKKILEESDVDNLYSTYGLDKRIIISLAKNRGIEVFHENNTNKTFFAYHFDSSKNIYKNPLQDYN
ncbi:MAG: hypothetical protein ACQEWU_16225 [Bacillota bacterium]